MKEAHTNITIPVNTRTLEKGERIQRHDKTRTGVDVWKEVPRSLVGTLHDGAIIIVTPLPVLPERPEESNLDATIRERVNALEVRRDIVRAEIDNPPSDAGVYYFTDRLAEHRTLCLMIEAIRDLLK